MRSPPLARSALAVDRALGRICAAPLLPHSPLHLSPFSPSVGQQQGLRVTGAAAAARGREPRGGRWVRDDGDQGAAVDWRAATATRGHGSEGRWRRAPPLRVGAYGAATHRAHGLPRAARACSLDSPAGNRLRWAQSREWVDSAL